MCKNTGYAPLTSPTARSSPFARHAFLLPRQAETLLSPSSPFSRCFFRLLMKVDRVVGGVEGGSVGILAPCALSSAVPWLGSIFPPSPLSPAPLTPTPPPPDTKHPSPRRNLFNSPRLLLQPRLLPATRYASANAPLHPPPTLPSPTSLAITFLSTSLCISHNSLLPPLTLFRLCSIPARGTGSSLCDTDAPSCSGRLTGGGG